MSNDTKQLEIIVKMIGQQGELIKQQGKMIEQSNINLLEFKKDIKEDLQEIKYDLRLDKQKLDAVYDERKQVTVKFTRAWSVMAVVITLAAGFVSATIALAMN